MRYREKITRKEQHPWRVCSALTLSLMVMITPVMGEHKNGYIAPFLTLSVDVKDLRVNCFYSKGKGFFGFLRGKR